MKKIVTLITLFILDRITKWLVLSYVSVPYVVNQYLAFNLSFNRGITWGIFGNTSQTAFVLITLLIIIITIALGLYAYVVYQNGFSNMPMLLIIIGSISNIIDRLWYGAVIDFIQLSYENWQWPIFNLADVYIVIGVVWLLYNQLFEQEKPLLGPK